MDRRHQAIGVTAYWARCTEVLDDRRDVGPIYALGERSQHGRARPSMTGADAAEYGGTDPLLILVWYAVA
jgi:hypothetical protein